MTRKHTVVTVHLYGTTSPTTGEIWENLIDNLEHHNHDDNIDSWEVTVIEDVDSEDEQLLEDVADYFQDKEEAEFEKFLDENGLQTF